MVTHMLLSSAFCKRVYHLMFRTSIDGMKLQIYSNGLFKGQCLFA